MSARERERRERALRAYGDAQFACGSWPEDAGEDEHYDEVYRRAQRAEAQLRRLLGLMVVEEATGDVAGAGHPSGVAAG